MEIEEVKADESDPRVVTLEEIMKLSMEGRWNDVTIICEDGKIQSNSFLLASMFPVFRDIFSYFESEEDIFISMPDISIIEIDLFLKAVYQKNNSVMNVSVGTVNLLGLKMQHFEVAKPVQLVDADAVSFVKVESFNDHDDAHDSSESYNDHDHDYAGEGKLEPRLATVTAIVKINFAKSQEEKDNKSEWTHVEKQVRIHQDKKGERKKDERQCHGECGNTECRKIFNRSYDLIRHINQQSGPQTCHICGKVVKNIVVMDNHMRNYHDSSRSKCSTCFKVMLTEKLEDHKKSCEKLSLVCSTCGKAFSSKCGLDNHIRTWHEVQKAGQKCDKCGKLFVRKELLKIHMRSHEEKTPCPECGVKVRRLNLHMKLVHTPDDQQPHQCQDCGKGFIDMKSLKDHRMNVHLKLRPYNCRYGCDIAYNDTSNRNQHEKKTHGKLFTTYKEKKMKLLNGNC